MTIPRDQFADMLDAFLDGRLNEEQTRALRAAAAADPALAAELAVAESADDALRRLYAPPAAADLLPEDLRHPSSIPFVAPSLPAAAPLQQALAHGGDHGSLVSRRGLLALAALVLLAITAAIYFNTAGGPVQKPAPVRKEALTPGQLYANLMARKFKPSFVCENEEQFAKFVGDRFGKGAVLAQAANVEILGWDYADGMIGEATAVVLARVDGRECVVAIDDKRYDHALTPPGGDLHLHRDICNGLVIYEISPFAEPRLLPLARPAPPLVMKTD